MLRANGNWGRWGRSSVAFLLLISLLSSAALLLLPVRESPADPTAPQASDRQVALVVTSLLRRQHLSKHPLDD